MRGRRSTAVCLMFSFGLAACGPEPSPVHSPSAAPTSSGAEITVSYPEEPLSLDPYSAEGDANATRDLLRPVLPTLLSIRPDLTYAPGLATKVPTPKKEQDGYRIRYRLDPRAVWSDGVPMGIDDLRYTWERARASRGFKHRTRYERVTDIRDLGNHVAEITIRGAPLWWKDLFSAGDFILPAHLLRGAQPSADVPPFAGGPFKIVEWERGSQITYVPNPKWWHKHPAVKAIHVQIVPDIEIAIGLLGAGRTDALSSGTAINLSRRLAKVAKVESRTGAAWWEMDLNASAPFTRDQRFREAVSRALDRAGLAEAVIRSEGRALQAIGPGPKSEHEGAFADANKDLQRSADLLNRLRGGGDGNLQTGGANVAISGPANNEITGLYEQALQVALRGLKVELDQKNTEASELYGSWRKDSVFQIGLFEMRGTPADTLLASFRSDLVPPDGANYLHASSEKLDRALAAGEDDGQAAPRNAIQNAIREGWFAIPLFEEKVYFGISERVKGPSPNATVEGPFWNLEVWQHL